MWHEITVGDEAWGDWRRRACDYYLDRESIRLLETIWNKDLVCIQTYILFTLEARSDYQYKCLDSFRLRYSSHDFMYPIKQPISMPISIGKS